MARAFDVETVDPWAQLTAPPVDETPEQRRIRERREEAERKISEEIDEALKLEREEMRAKRRNRLKVLLLGQSESGKWKPKIFHLSLSFDCMKGRTGHHFFSIYLPHLVLSTLSRRRCLSVSLRSIVTSRCRISNLSSCFFPSTGKIPRLSQIPSRRSDLDHRRAVTSPRLDWGEQTDLLKPVPGGRAAHSLGGVRVYSTHLRYISLPSVMIELKKTSRTDVLLR